MVANLCTNQRLTSLELSHCPAPATLYPHFLDSWVYHVRAANPPSPTQPAVSCASCSGLPRAWKPQTGLAEASLLPGEGPGSRGTGAARQEQGTLCISVNIFHTSIERERKSEKGGKEGGRKSRSACPRDGKSSLLSGAGI